MVTQQAVETATTQDGDFLTSMRNAVITALPLAGLFEIVPPVPRISGLGGSSLRATGRIDRGNQPAHPCRIGSLCRRASGRSSPAAITAALTLSSNKTDPESPDRAELPLRTVDVADTSCCSSNTPSTITMHTIDVLDACAPWAIGRGSTKMC